MTIDEARNRVIDMFCNLRNGYVDHLTYGGKGDAETEADIHALDEVLMALDNWLDRYDKGFDKGLEKGVDIMVDCLRNKYKVIKERCKYIEVVISEMELNYPELHTEVGSIDKALEEIRRQVK